MKVVGVGAGGVVGAGVGVGGQRVGRVVVTLLCNN